MTSRGVLCSASFDGATDTELFVTFVRETLAPLLARGRVVVPGNLQPHKAPEVRRLVEAAGATLLLLPPYSPDFNPIEMAISKVKTVLRKLARRTVDALFDGIGDALASVTPTDALHYISHCGYAAKQ
jgi:transposase